MTNKTKAEKLDTVERERERERESYSREIDFFCRVLYSICKNTIKTDRLLKKSQKGEAEVAYPFIS